VKGCSRNGREGRNRGHTPTWGRINALLHVIRVTAWRRLNVRGDPDLPTPTHSSIPFSPSQRNWIFVVRRGVSATDLPVIDGLQLALLPTSDLRPAAGGRFQLRVVLPDREVNTLKTSKHSKKDVPLHLQLVHPPSGWCSAVSEGFVLRKKVRLRQHRGARACSTACWIGGLSKRQLVWS